MALDLDMFRADLEAIRDDLAHDVTVGGETHSSVVSDVSVARQEYQAGGFFPDDLLEVVIIPSEWTSVPDVGNTLTTTAKSGRTFRIVRTSSDPSGAGLRLFCEGRAQ